MRWTRQARFDEAWLLRTAKACEKLGHLVPRECRRATAFFSRPILKDEVFMCGATGFRPSW
jgi:hypothetical protein